MLQSIIYILPRASSLVVDSVTDVSHGPKHGIVSQVTAKNGGSDDHHNHLRPAVDGKH